MQARSANAADVNQTSAILAQLLLAEHCLLLAQIDLGQNCLEALQCFCVDRWVIRLDGIACACC